MQDRYLSRKANYKFKQLFYPKVEGYRKEMLYEILMGGKMGWNEAGERDLEILKPAVIISGY